MVFIGVVLGQGFTLIFTLAADLGDTAVVVVGVAEGAGFIADTGNKVGVGVAILGIEVAAGDAY